MKCVTCHISGADTSPSVTFSCLREPAVRTCSKILQKDGAETESSWLFGVCYLTEQRVPSRTFSKVHTAHSTEPITAKCTLQSAFSKVHRALCAQHRVKYMLQTFECSLHTTKCEEPIIAKYTVHLAKCSYHKRYQISKDIENIGTTQSQQLLGISLFISRERLHLYILFTYEQLTYSFGLL